MRSALLVSMILALTLPGWAQPQPVGRSSKKLPLVRRDGILYYPATMMPSSASLSYDPGTNQVYINGIRAPFKHIVYQGMVYVPFDPRGRGSSQLARHLKNRRHELQAHQPGAHPEGMTPYQDFFEALDTEAPNVAVSQQGPRPEAEFQIIDMDHHSSGPLPAHLRPGALPPAQVKPLPGFLPRPGTPEAPSCQPDRWPARWGSPRRWGARPSRDHGWASLTSARANGAAEPLCEFRSILEQ